MDGAQYSNRGTDWVAVTNNVPASLTLRKQVGNKLSVFTTRIDLPSQQTLCARDLVRPLPSPPRGPCDYTYSACVTLDQIARNVFSVTPDTMLDP